MYDDYQQYIEMKRDEVFGGNIKYCRTRFENSDRKNAEMMTIGKSYAETFEADIDVSKNLLILGNIGVGKSHLARCIANELIDRDLDVIMTTIPEIERKLWGERDKEYFYTNIDEADLLILDDLAVERQTEYMQEIMYNIIDARYKSCKPMIITTNLTPEEVENPKTPMLARVLSRIIENGILLVYAGSDRRMQNAFERSQSEIGRLLNGKKGGV